MPKTFKQVLKDIAKIKKDRGLGMPKTKKIRAWAIVNKKCKIAKVRIAKTYCFLCRAARRKDKPIWAVNGIDIKQKHEDCHYETCFSQSGMPIAIGYGFTQKEADTKALIGFMREGDFIGKKDFRLEKLKKD